MGEREGAALVLVFQHLRMCVCVASRGQQPRAYCHPLLNPHTTLLTGGHRSAVWMDDVRSTLHRGRRLSHALSRRHCVGP